MDIVDTSKEAFYDRGGMTSHNKNSGDERSKDRSAYTVRSPGQEHPLRYFSGWHAGQAGTYSEKQNYFGGNGGNDACTDPAYNNINFVHGGETESWNSNARLNICQRPTQGMATHTCADQSNRKTACSLHPPLPLLFAGTATHAPPPRFQAPFSV